MLIREFVYHPLLLAVGAVFLGASLLAMLFMADRRQAGPYKDRGQRLN